MERLNKAVVGSERPDLFFKNRIRTDAKAAMKADPYGAHTCLGLLEALDGREESAHDHYRVARQHVQSREDLSAYYFNYAMLCGLLHDVDGALEQIDKAVTGAPGDPTFVRYAMFVALQAGDLPRSVARADELLAMMKNNDNQASAGEALRIRRAEYLLNKQDVKDGEIRALCISAAKILREQDVWDTAWSCDVVEYEGLESIRLNIDTPELNVAQAIGLQRLLDEAVFEVWPDDRHYDAIGVGFTPGHV